MEAGRVKWFDSRRGFGFITPENQLIQDLFVHYTGIAGKGYKSLVRGQSVHFEVSDGPKGLQAVNVSLLEPIHFPITEIDKDSIGNLRLS